MTDFARLVRAEWTKFRTVRGWVLGMLVAALVIVSLGLFSAAGSHTTCGGASEVCPAVPVGPDGEAVNDKFFFVHRPLQGDGSLTARVTSMTGQMRLPDAIPGVRNVASGVVPWAKAGLMIKDGTREGSAYAAVMVTGGHGVRMQHDFTHDVAGRPGGVSKDSPRWLRLTRAGDTITGFESADGRNWTRIGTAELAGLSATVRIGLFAASPGALTVTPADLGGSITAERFAEASATFDQVGPQGEGWTYDDVAATLNPDGTAHHPGSASRTAGTFTVTGTGDIGPRLDGPTIANTLTGVPAGLIALVVVSVSVITTEYRRGLIHTSLLASPRRGRLLAAKAIVAAAAAFASGLAAAGVVVPAGTRILRANGNVVLPVSWLTELRVVVGMAAFLAAAAVLALALGALFRRSAAAVSAAIALVILPHILATASVLPAGVGQWLLRLTPAAGFAIQQSIPEYAHVLGNYAPSAGFYPLPPWAGLAVLCGYAVLALAAAAFHLSRRDA
ncbi:ABC transporter permease subunit [Nonomuraea typhae]|uniref:ABC transporter permease subunit n=1 Tax=Nonomuraea typhae TaxID=2603600 RepID=UPI0012FC6A67|nr:ABC transporter permease subunit [Nonomuraea typhae]